MGSDMKPRKDRRFKQWNKTKIALLTEPRPSVRPPLVEAFTYDISIGGARLHAANAIEAGTLIRLEISLTRSREVLRVEAVVKWCRFDETAKVHELGCEFQHSSMVTVLALMRELHDVRSALAPKSAAVQDDLRS